LTPISRCVIFANGTIPDLPAARAAIRPDDLIIAADGGSRHCLALNLSPEFVIGDLDSLEPTEQARLQTGGSRFEQHPRDKDQTDLELAIRFAVSAGAPEILLLGLLGGRLDQTLANLLLLARPDWGQVRLSLVDGPDTAWLLRSGDSLQIAGIPGDLVSLIPLSNSVTGVTTWQLRWPLQAARLPFGSTWGISNEILTAPAAVQIDAGLLLVIHRQELQPGTFHQEE
jgi:thiamine pyrophosphokinase